MRSPDAAVADLAATSGFSGVVRVEAGSEVLLDVAYGLADRRHTIPVTTDTRFATASATKGLTACTISSLVADRALTLDTPARSLLGTDLPLIGDDVTVEHLLTHRSGIGDYVDEDAGDLEDLVLKVPVGDLTSIEAYLPALDGFPAKFPAGTAFSYCNSGYAVLALLAERAAGTPFPTLVEQRVCTPAGMTSTSFLRSDELPGDAAVGYLGAEGLRSNVFLLPAVGSGDGGIYTTAADLSAFWRALFDGRIVDRPSVEAMVAPRSDAPDLGRRYGAGFWLPGGDDDLVMLEGYDHGASCRSLYNPRTDEVATVLSNTAAGAWPIARYLQEAMA